MAVRDDFAPGEVLTAGDLNDTFASKADASAVTGSNLLYNGAMQVAQRGTSTASITTGGYPTADRWALGVQSLGTWTQSVENDAPTGSGFRKSLKMLCTTADAAPSSSDFLFIEQKIEGQDLQRIAKGTASAQQLTLSFWVKSNVTGTFVCNLLDIDNNRQVGAAYTISASATWERKTITFAADTSGPLDNDNNESLRVRFWMAAGSGSTSGSLRSSWTATTDSDLAVGQTNLAAATNNYWQVTGVQLEVGPVGTGFEFKSYGQELRECQRYYWQPVDEIAVRTSPTNTSSWLVTAQVYFPVTMRTNPILTYTTGNGTANKVDALNNLGGIVSSAYGLEQFTGTSQDRASLRFYETAISYSGIALKAKFSAEL